MKTSKLTHIWSEAPQLSDALSKFPQSVTRLIADPADPVGSAKPAQAILAASAIRYNDDVFDRLPNLRILVRTGIGIDNVDLDAATRHRVVFCNTPDGPTESTAEHTIALMLAVAKQVKPGMEQLAAGDFAPRGLPMGTELMGKTLGLVGLGRIGGRVAHICGRGFGMRVLAFDPYISAERAAGARRRTRRFGHGHRQRRLPQSARALHAGNVPSDERRPLRADEDGGRPAQSGPRPVGGPERAVGSAGQRTDPRGGDGRV